MREVQFRTFLPTSFEMQCTYYGLRLKSGVTLCLRLLLCRSRLTPYGHTAPFAIYIVTLIELLNW